MSDKQNTSSDSPTTPDTLPADFDQFDRPAARIARVVSAAQWFLLSPPVAMSLLVVAMIEALLSPFLGWRFALASLATAAVAVGLILAHGAMGVQCVGSWLAGIHTQISGLHETEIKNLATKSQQRAAPPEKPLPSWK